MRWLPPEPIEPELLHASRARLACLATLVFVTAIVSSGLLIEGGQGGGVFLRLIVIGGGTVAAVWAVLTHPRIAPEGFVRYDWFEVLARAAGAGLGVAALALLTQWLTGRGVTHAAVFLVALPTQAVLTAWVALAFARRPADG